MRLRIASALLIVATGCGGCDAPAASTDADPDPEIDASRNDAPLDADRTEPVIHYVKASNTQFGDLFGSAVAIAGDGNTIAISAPREQSGATGVNGDQSSNTSGNAGAVYVFVRSGSTWVQQAYVKASNTGANYDFGSSVALSYDGNTMAVGSPGEHSASTGINQSQADDNLAQAGAVYVFARSNGAWTQQAYVKASNTNMFDNFGGRVALSADGSTLAVAAHWESSNAIGIDGNQLNENASLSGAVYVFVRAGLQWSQQAYVKASNTDSGDYFGSGLALAGDGNTMAVGAFGEASGVAGDQTNNTMPSAGAVYVFIRTGAIWAQQSYLKAPYPGVEDYFGTALSLSADGSTLAVGSELEDSNARGIDQDAQNNSAMNSGAAFVFQRTGTTWSTPVYIKASNSDAGDYFGSDVALTAGGDRLLVGAHGEASASIGYVGDPSSNAAEDAGAAYLFTRTSGSWTETGYLKASNTDPYDGFGIRAAIAANGATIAISAPTEMSSATGIDGNQTLNTTASAGAAYVFE